MKRRQPQHKVGDQIGTFALERLLGQGASAEVWLVNEQGELGFTKRQALKLLRPPPGDIEGQKKALINEGRVCGRLKHRSLVDVYRVGEEGGLLYIAMEYVEGPDLNSLLSTLRRRSILMPVRAALEAIVELAEALDHAHTRTDDDGQLLGIVHRDLKPSNVLVTRDATLKISDWGLVKSSLNIDSTSRGIVKGTPGYIAPEVWGGTRDFKPTADLFALGAMLYEMVVGERLFRGKNLARIAEQVARRKPEDEAARVRTRCPELEVVLARMLQRAPQKRYATAETFASALRPIRDRYPATEGLKSFIHSIQPIIDELGPQNSNSAAGATVVEVKPPSMPNLADPGKPDAPAQEPAGPGFTVHSPTAKHIEVPVDAANLDPASFDEEGGTVPAVRVRAIRPAAANPGKQVEVEVAAVVPRVAPVPSQGASGHESSRASESAGARRRALPAVRRSGPSTVLGVCVAFVGILLLGIGVYAYTQLGL